MEIQSKRTTRSAVKRKLCSTASQDGPTSIGKTKNLVGELRGDDIFEPHEVTSPTVQKHASTKPPKEKKTEYSKGPDEVFKNPVCKTATGITLEYSLSMCKGLEY